MDTFFSTKKYREIKIKFLPFFITKKGRAKKASAVFLSLRFTSEISTTSVITGVLPRGSRISVRYTCSKNKARLVFEVAIAYKTKRLSIKNLSLFLVVTVYISLGPE